jgi:hypothetical protein
VIKGAKVCVGLDSCMNTVFPINKEKATFDIKSQHSMIIPHAHIHSIPTNI